MSAVIPGRDKTDTRYRCAVPPEGGGTRFRRMPPPVSSRFHPPLSRGERQVSPQVLTCSGTDPVQPGFGAGTSVVFGHGLRISGGLGA